ncbi:right-handed parallel beta-helix repeat-containing protein [Candidatus Parcubacteria bacterium]|nr:right-handed parallel beta-helix repeat-containing protein [Candidatus Parcubacteria bacterium]
MNKRKCQKEIKTTAKRITEKYKPMKIVLASLAFLMIIPAVTFAEDALLEPQISGKVEGTGSYFEIIDSEYLNISLKSTEEITIDIESIPRMISMDISSSTDFASTNLTISGLEPNTTYYKFQDSYKNKAVFVSNRNGEHNWTQDLTQSHHIWIQPEADAGIQSKDIQTLSESDNVVFLPEECSDYGIWNEGTSTCTLTQDLIESIEITESNITLDCAGYNMTGSDTGYGVYVNRKTNVAVKNCTVNNFHSGAFFYYGSNSTLNNNNVSNNKSHGIRLTHSDNNILVDNIVNSNNDFGICLYYSSYNTITDNDISLNQHGIYIFLSHYNTVTENTLRENTEYGLRMLCHWYWPAGMVMCSKDNEIFHNNFIDNHNSPEMFVCDTDFLDNDYPSGGNYWSDYTGVDEKSGPEQDQPGSDGIGDTPYLSYNFWGGYHYGYYCLHPCRDRYPFIQESGWEAPQSPTYNIAVILAEPSDPDKFFDFSHNKEYFESITEQVEDYYCENSFGKWDPITKTCNGGLFNLNFDVYDNNELNYKLEQTQKHYGKNFSQVQEISFGLDGQGREIKVKDEDRTEQFIWDAINKADEDIDYNDYQSVIVIYWGDSEQKLLSLQKYPLSSQWWTPSFSPAPINSPTEFINNWIAVAENGTKYVWSHELGHALGNILTGYPLCDLYSTANPCYDGGYGGSVPNYFDIMGGATNIWSVTQNITSYFSSFSKIKLGWLQENVVEYGSHTIESLETMKFGDEVARYNLANDSYYLLEARTNNSAYSKWDTDLPDNPLVIYKISPKEITVNNETTTINFVNIAKSVGIISLGPLVPPIPDPLNSPFKDPINNVFVEINNRIAEPDSFKINAQISECTLSNYVGTVLRPKLSLLEKIWEFASDPFKVNEISSEFDKEEQKEILYFHLHPMGPGERFYLHVFGYKIEQIYEYASVRYLSMITSGLQQILALLIISLFFLRFWIIKKQKAKKTILRIIIFLAIIFILTFFVSFASAHSNNLTTPLNVSYKSISADVDLHAYDELGRHTGMNYETGEYENQIPEAIASGDLVYDDEWIFVPEETKVHFVVSSKDIQEMIETYPELQELTDGIETYEVQAIYYDEASQQYKSNISTEQIEPGQELEQPITGTTDIAVLPAIPWQTPKLLKEQSISLLEESKTNNKAINREIDSIIRHIDKSLDNALWIDDFRLDSNQGRKVLFEQSFAVSRLYHKARIFNTKTSILERIIEIKQKFGLDTEKEETEIEAINTVLPVFNQVVDNLIKADRIIAETAINDAKNTPIGNPMFQNTVDRFIEKAERELSRAEKEISKARPDKAVMRLSQSWSYAQLAVKFAAPSFFKSHTTGLRTRFLGALNSFFHLSW